MLTQRFKFINSAYLIIINFNHSVSFNFFAAELKMDVLREREVKDSLDRQLIEERKLRGEFMSP